MDFLSKKTSFDLSLWVKSDPNNHEKQLFQRAQKYIQKITWIPGIRMIAVANSLSMYATHTESDIDLFVVTARNRIWIVRILMTLCFWSYGVWRKGEDIAENFCLSFFVEEASMDLSKIALKDDIYLYFWIYYLKPLYEWGDTYERFLEYNSWVDVPLDVRRKNRSYTLKSGSHIHDSWIWYQYILSFCNSIFRFFWEYKSQRSFEKKGSPFGVIIRPTLLKFHDRDKRAEIRDALI